MDPLQRLVRLRVKRFHLSCQAGGWHRDRADHVRRGLRHDRLTAANLFDVAIDDRAR